MVNCRMGSACPVAKCAPNQNRRGRIAVEEARKVHNIVQTWSDLAIFDGSRSTDPKQQRFGLDIPIGCPFTLNTKRLGRCGTFRAYEYALDLGLNRLANWKWKNENSAHLYFCRLLVSILQPVTVWELSSPPRNCTINLIAGKLCCFPSNLPVVFCRLQKITDKLLYRQIKADGFNHEDVAKVWNVRRVHNSSFVIIDKVLDILYFKYF